MIEACVVMFFRDR